MDWGEEKVIGCVFMGRREGYMLCLGGMGGGWRWGGRRLCAGVAIFGGVGDQPSRSEAKVRGTVALPAALTRGCFSGNPRYFPFLVHWSFFDKSQSTLAHLAKVSKLHFCKKLIIF